MLASEMLIDQRFAEHTVHSALIPVASSTSSIVIQRHAYGNDRRHRSIGQSSLHVGTRCAGRNRTSITKLTAVAVLLIPDSQFHGLGKLYRGISDAQTHYARASDRFQCCKGPSYSSAVA